jgi:hypothetical protein
VPKLDYPKILTNKDWQSKKAVLDKVGKNKKTGVGDELDLFEKAYLKTDFAKPSDGVKPTTYDPLRFQGQLSQMRQHFMAERKKIEAQYLATDKKIDAAIKVLGAGSSSGKHLAKVKAALSAFRGHDMAEHPPARARQCQGVPGEYAEVDRLRLRRGWREDPQERGAV